MRAFEADYFDGIHPRGARVSVQIVAPHLRFFDGTKQHEYLLRDIALQAKLGGARRQINLPDLQHLEADDIADLEAALPQKSTRFWRGLHYVENHLGLVLAALVVTVALGWAFVQYGVPVIATQIAKITPLRIEKQMGQATLDTMDNEHLGYFKPSITPLEHRQTIEKALSNFCTAQTKMGEACPSYTLNFRQGGAIGANAFALPGGLMVVTDELVDLSKNDTEIIAVIAHELGHVQKRHALRQTIQGALAGFIIAAVTGDFSSIASGLPAVLLQLSYTRNMETEADQYALKTLQNACLPPQAFADILTRLTAAVGGSSVPEIVSSHPDTQARIKPFTHLKSQCL